MNQRISPQRLLESARHEDDPATGAEERVRIKLMQRLAVGAGAGSGAAAVAKGASAATTLIKGVAVGCALSVAAMSAAVVLRSGKPAPASSVAAGHAPTRASSASSATSPSPSAAGPAALPQSSAVPVAPSAPPRSSPLRPASPPVSAAADQRDELLAEAAGLRAAYAAVQGKPAAALKLLAEQERLFPGGALTEERALVRILALCHLGSDAEASNARARFLEQFPRSPLVPRVRALCAARDP